MPETEQRSEIDRLRAFELRMQTEGAAGFADGLEPWNSWPEADNADDGKRNWRCDREREDTPPGRTLCEKMLSAVATLAVATLAVGIGGVYLSTQSEPQMALDATRPAAAVATAEPAADPLPAGKVIRPAPENIALAKPGAIVTVTTAPPVELAGAMPETTAAVIRAMEPSGTPLAASGNTPSIQAQADMASAFRLLQNPDGPSRADIGAGLPAPAAGTAAATSTKRVTPFQTAGQVATGTPTETTLPAPAAGPAADTSTAVSMIAPPAIKLPATGNPASIGGGEGPWVVNISSYTYESMARRKLGEFRDQGVNAEIYPVTIKGKPMYRIRATGYESRSEAKTWLSLLQDRLDVDSAWVSKR
jgi:hypothetical protein